MAYQETDKTVREDLLDLLEMSHDETITEGERIFRRRLVRCLAKMVGQYSAWNIDRSSFGEERRH